MKRLAIAALLPVVLVGAAWIAGTILVAPFQRDVGSLPSDLSGEAVEFPSESGSQIHGWFLPGRERHGAIVIMHGVRACRLDMLDRARFLSQTGYAVLPTFRRTGKVPASTSLSVISRAGTRGPRSHLLGRVCLAKRLG